jgi:transmembrane sensor
VAPDHIDWRLITAHLAGETTPDEERLLREWLDADPARVQRLRVLRAAWGGPARPVHDHDVDAAWARVERRLWPETAAGAPAPRNATAAVPPQASAGRRSRWRALLGVAAVALLLVLPLATWPWIGARLDTATDTYVSVVVPRGQHTELRLADGSRVVVGPESTLRYHRRFDGPEREIHLEGMAYFEVVPDPARPFVVHARGAATRVLGTRFVVQAYADDAQVRVAVTEGRVEVRPSAVPDAPVLPVGSGEVGEVDRDGAMHSLRPAVLDSYVGWTQGRLSVDEQRLDRVLSLIGRWYDVEVVVEDPDLASRRITTTLDNEPLAGALSLIALSVDAHVVQRGDTVVFHPNLRTP